MKSSFSSSIVLIAGFFIAAAGLAHGAQQNDAPATKSGKLVALTEKDAAWAAKARKEYPLDVCVVSEEKLGAMGESPEFIHRVEGQPDRLVIFCCKGCSEDFLMNATAHLAAIDAAKKNGEAGAGAKAGHDAKH